MSETGLTLTEDMTFAELYKEYEEEQKKIMELDYSNLSEADKQLLKDHSDKQKFLKEMAASLDYAQNSGALLSRQENGKEIASLEVITSKEAYVSEILTLTNGLDRDVMAELQKGEDKFAVNELNAQMETVLSEPSIQAELRRQIQERGNSEITVKEIQDIQIQIQNEQREADLRLQEQQREELQKLQEQQEQERQQEELRRQQEEKEPSNAERFARLAEATALVVVATEVMPELTKATEKIKESSKEKEEEKKREQDGKEVSVSAEIADDGHAVIKNIEGEGKADEKGNIDRTEVDSKIEQKVTEKKQEIKETVDLHSREVAPKSEKAETERKAEKPIKRNRDVMDR